MINSLAQPPGHQLEAPPSRFPESTVLRPLMLPLLILWTRPSTLVKVPTTQPLFLGNQNIKSLSFQTCPVKFANYIF